MACCLKHSSNQRPVSPAPRANTDKDQSFGLALLLTGEVSDAAASSRYTDFQTSSVENALFVPTLQTSHVRIQT